MPKGPKGEKRPADVIGAAVKVMQIATGEIEETTDDDSKNKAAVQAVQRARPDMTAADALAAVNLVRHK